MTDLMTHFVGKVQKIHASTAGADAMSTVKQSDVELSMFQPVTSDHVLQLLRKEKHLINIVLLIQPLRG